MAKADSMYQRIYAAVRRVPKGRVTTYGAIARLAGYPGAARQVGYALSALPTGTAVPWHRVINAQGRLSLERSASGAGIAQRMRLQAEGVVVNAAGGVSLERYGWKVKAAESRRANKRSTRPAARETR